MADIIEERISSDDLCRRLCLVMTDLELREFVEAMEDVASAGNGYGQVTVDLEDGRVKLLRATSSRKPGVR